MRAIFALILIVSVIFVSYGWEWDDNYVPTSDPSTGSLFHVVQPDETLASISSFYFNTEDRWIDIFEWNQLRWHNLGLPKPDDVLVPDQILIIQQDTNARLLAVENDEGLLELDQVTFVKDALRGRTSEYWQRLWSWSDSLAPTSKSYSVIFENASPYTLTNWVCSCNGTNITFSNCPLAISSGQSHVFSLTQSQQLGDSGLISCALKAQIDGILKQIEIGILSSDRSSNPRYSNYLAIGSNSVGSPNSFGVSNSGQATQILASWRTASQTIGVATSSSNFINFSLPADFYGLNVFTHIPQGRIGDFLLIFST